ncbi:hypothetical protein LIER_15631 [Lithospermum erythrorhizon]|uniref:Hexosyltransferase n=1 Tax=Lithospermum erythrorhizon TaxID=34254 RepID=A0AAV3Q592_LITER
MRELIWWLQDVRVSLSEYVKVSGTLRHCAFMVMAMLGVYFLKYRLSSTRSFIACPEKRYSSSKDGSTGPKSPNHKYNLKDELVKFKLNYKGAPISEPSLWTMNNLFNKRQYVRASLDDILTVVTTVHPKPVDHALMMGWIAFKGGKTLYAHKVVIMDADEDFSVQKRPLLRWQIPRNRHRGLHTPRSTPPRR